jgi:hypothetical protein
MTASETRAKVFGSGSSRAAQSKVQAAFAIEPLRLASQFLDRLDVVALNAFLQVVD